MNEAELLQQNDEMRRNQYLALNGGIAAIVAALSMVVIKSIAYVFSGSSSILASLIDSVTDSAISIITVFSIRYSMKPADEDHSSYTLFRKPQKQDRVKPPLFPPSISSLCPPPGCKRLVKLP